MTTEELLTHPGIKGFLDNFARYCGAPRAVFEGQFSVALQSARDEMREQCIRAVCDLCRAGVLVEKDQWRGWEHPQGAETPDGRKMTYSVQCLAHMIRRFE